MDIDKIDRDKKFKKVEAMLYNYTATSAEIKNLELEIDAIKNNYEGAAAINYSEKTGTTNKFNSTVENEIINKENKINFLKRIKYQKELEIKKINNALDSLTDKEKEIVKCRYFNKIGNRRTAYKLDLTEQRISDLKNDIINKIIKITLL